MSRAPTPILRSYCVAVATLLGACLPAPVVAPAAPTAAQCPAPPTFERSEFVEDTQFSSTIGAVSRMLAADYTTDADNLHTANTATEACKRAKIILAPDVTTPALHKDQITAALEGGKKTGPAARAPECLCLKDGAMQEDVGLCKAQVFTTTKPVDLYQFAGPTGDRPPYNKFWSPYDLRYPTRMTGKMIKCTIPKGTLVAIGVKKNPYATTTSSASSSGASSTTTPAAAGTTPPADEFATFWFVGDTWGTWGNKDRQPRKWKCITIE